MDRKKETISRIIKINAPTCLQVDMYLTEPMRDGNSVVLMQAWHWFENKWHYQSEEFIFFYRSTALGFIADMTTQTATDWVNEYRFTK